MRQWIGVVVACGVMAACSHPGTANTEAPPAPSPQSISGTYVGGGHNAANDQLFIQALRLTQSASGQFTGTLETNTLSQSGKDTATTQNVSGSYDGSHVTLVLDDGLGHTNRNATWTAGTITLTWLGDNGQPNTEKFLSKTDEEYATILQQVSTARQKLLDEHNAAEQGAAQDKTTGELVARLQRFLSKEADWHIEPIAKQREKALAFGDNTIAKINELLALHRDQADVAADQVDVGMTQGQIQLNQSLDGTDRNIAGDHQTMAALDQALATSPCLTPAGDLRPGVRPACDPLPALAIRYKSIHDGALAKLAQASSLTAQTRSDYDAKVKEADRLTRSR